MADAKANLTYRQAIPEDIPAIMVLVERIRNQFDALGIKQWEPGWPSEQMFLDDMKRPGGVGLAFDENNTLVSFFVLNANDEGEGNDEVPWLCTGKHFVIHRFGVDSSRQGEGIGSSVLAHCEQMARDAGCESMRLDVFYTNYIAQKIYRRRGYKLLAYRDCLGHSGHYYSMELPLIGNPDDYDDVIVPPTEEEVRALADSMK